ncbi:hypothetical protein B9Z55_007657 [Caenorhabditis nigoni]|nr:hypothetical protein B9Z55_007657 [Caenorhabditis nigoni]
MTTKLITYESEQTSVAGIKTIVLETGEKDGVKHTWSGYVDNNYKANFIWNFDWEELKKQGAIRLVGQLIVSAVYDHWQPHRIDIDWTEANQSTSTTLGSGYCFYIFEYNLTAQQCVFFEYHYSKTLQNE